MDLSNRLSTLNRELTNYYNPRNVLTIKYYNSRKLSLILKVNKISEFPYMNFNSFLEDERNSSKICKIVKLFRQEYGFVNLTGVSFSGIFNPDNWKYLSGNEQVFEYFLIKQD